MDTVGSKPSVFTSTTTSVQASGDRDGGTVAPSPVGGSGRQGEICLAGAALHAWRLPPGDVAAEGAGEVFQAQVVLAWLEELQAEAPALGMFWAHVVQRQRSASPLLSCQFAASHRPALRVAALRDCALSATAVVCVVQVCLDGLCFKCGSPEHVMTTCPRADTCGEMMR